MLFCCRYPHLSRLVSLHVPQCFPIFCFSWNTLIYTSPLCFPLCFSVSLLVFWVDFLWVLLLVSLPWSRISFPHLSYIVSLSLSPEFLQQYLMSHVRLLSISVSSCSACLCCQFLALGPVHLPCSAPNKFKIKFNYRLSNSWQEANQRISPKNVELFPWITCQTRKHFVITCQTAHPPHVHLPQILPEITTTALIEYWAMISIKDSVHPNVTTTKKEMHCQVSNMSL